MVCLDSENRLAARHNRAVLRVQFQRQLKGYYKCMLCKKEDTVLALEITEEEDEKAEMGAKESMRRNNQQGTGNANENDNHTTKHFQPAPQFVREKCQVDESHVNSEGT